VANLPACSHQSAAVLLYYILPALALHKRHDVSPTLQYSPVYFSMTSYSNNRHS